MAVRTQPVAWAVSLTLVASALLVPAPALAQRVHGGSGGGRVVVGSPAGSRAFAHHRSAPGSFAPRSFFSHRGFAPFGAVVVYAPLAYGSPDYYDPPLAYAPQAMYAPPTGGTLSLAPPPSPMPSVVEFPRPLRASRRRDHRAIPVGVDPESPGGSARSPSTGGPHGRARAPVIEEPGTQPSHPAVSLDRPAGRRSPDGPQRLDPGSVPPVT